MNRRRKARERGRASWGISQNAWYTLKVEWEVMCKMCVAESILIISRAAPEYDGADPVSHDDIDRVVSTGDYKADHTHTAQGHHGQPETVSMLGNQFKLENVVQYLNEH